MKTLLRPNLLLISGILFLNCMCGREEHRRSCPDDAICTASFAMITTQVENGGRPLRLDDAYTVLESTGEVIRPEQELPASGQYVVLDDSFQKRLANRTESFRFVGIKNGLKVVDEAYTIGADCCHIHKQNGLEKIDINL